LKLLITVRDPATAISFKKLLPALIAHSEFNCRVLCQAPATEILAEFKQQLDWFAVDEATLKQHFIDFKPDIILTGISGPDTGIDEAALLQAKKLGIHSFALQSFWGDINQASQAVPDTAFVLDDEAKKITSSRYPQIRSIAIGSIKHIDYHQFDALKQRQIVRPPLVILASGDISEDLVLGFYGQPILNVPGYFKTIEGLVRQLKKWQRPFQLIYRPHPKESAESQTKTILLFKQAFGNKATLDSQQDIKNSLVACDLVLSAFSTCGFDNLYLNEMAKKPFNTSVYLWFEPELIKWWQDYSQLKEMPLISEDLLLAVNTENSLLPILEQGLLESVKQRLWQNAKQKLPEPSHAIEIMIKTMLQHGKIK